MDTMTNSATESFLSALADVLMLGKAVREQEAIARLPPAIANHPALDPDTYRTVRAALAADVVMGWRPLAELDALDRAAGAVQVRDLAHLRQRAELAREALPELRQRYAAARQRLLMLMAAAIGAARRDGVPEAEIDAFLDLLEAPPNNATPAPVAVTLRDAAPPVVNIRNKVAPGE
jgi:hypothetical protein